MVLNATAIIGILCCIVNVSAIFVDDFVLERNHIEILVDSLSDVSSIDGFVRRIYPQKDIFVDKAVRRALLKYGFGKKWSNKKICIDVYYNSTIELMKEPDTSECYQPIRHHLKDVGLKIDDIVSNASPVVALLNKLSKCCRQMENHCDCDSIPTEIVKYVKELEQLVDSIKTNNVEPYRDNYFVELINTARTCYEDKLMAEKFTILKNQLDNCIRNTD